MQLKVLDVRHASAGGGRVYVYGWDLVYGTDAASLIQAKAIAQRLWLSQLCRSKRLAEQQAGCQPCPYSSKQYSSQLLDEYSGGAADTKK